MIRCTWLKSGWKLKQMLRSSLSYYDHGTIGEGKGGGWGRGGQRGFLISRTILTKMIFLPHHVGRNSIFHAKSDHLIQCRYYAIMMCLKAFAIPI